MTSSGRPQRQTGRDRGSRSDSESQEALQDRLIEELLEGAEALAARWHEQLRQHLDIRPEDVFQGDELLDHAPDVVRWVIRSLQMEDEMDRPSVESIQEAARHWRSAGYSVEESLLHLRILNRLLHAQLREALRGMTPPPATQMACFLSERMSHAVMLLQVVLVGAYRDEEERRLNDLGNMMVHEIRNPLGAGLSGLQVLQLLEDRASEEGEAEDRRRKLLERIINSLSRADDLVTSVYYLMRSATAEMPESEPESLRALVSEVLGNLEREADAVELRQEGDIPEVQVPGDPVRLALHNLVRNAIRYADPEKPHPYVKVYCHYAAEKWLLCVEDNGVGIPEEEREQIFRRFRRGRAARGVGFGLGLSIVRQAAAVIGGGVTVESSEGTGTTFVFAIPAEKTWGGAPPHPIESRP